MKKIFTVEVVPAMNEITIASWCKGLPHYFTELEVKEYGRFLEKAKAEYNYISCIYAYGKLVGYMIGHITTNDKSLFYIMALEFHHKMRRQGFGKLFVEFLIDNVREACIANRIELESTPESYLFWVKMGFIDINQEAADIKNTRMIYKL